MIKRKKKSIAYTIFVLQNELWLTSISRLFLSLMLYVCFDLFPLLLSLIFSVLIPHIKMKCEFRHKCKYEKSLIFSVVHYKNVRKPSPHRNKMSKYPPQFFENKHNLLYKKCVRGSILKKKHVKKLWN